MLLVVWVGGCRLAEENLSLQEVKRTSKRCPGCGMGITKTEGKPLLAHTSFMSNEDDAITYHAPSCAP